MNTVDTREFAGKVLREAVQISIRLFKLMVPILIAVKVLQEIGGVVFLGKLLSPIMQVVGLPGSMGLVWATTLVANLYTGMAVFISLSSYEPVTFAQTTVIAAMMLVAHNLPIELRIVQKAGTRLRFMGLWRAGGAFLFGWILFRIYGWGGWLQEPNTTKLIPRVSDTSLSSWAISQIESLAMIFLIILALLLLIRILERIGISAIMVRILDPILRLLGIGPSASTLTIVGMTLGIAYGGGLIIQEAGSGRLNKQDVLFSLSLMGLCHSLIEDTLALSLIGADLSGILWARIAFSLLAVFLLVKLITRISEPALERFFVRPPSL